MAISIIDTFKKELRSSKPISLQEEQQLGYKILSGDTKAVEMLTKANLRYAYSYAEKYNLGLFPFEDIFESACFGMHEAAKRFDVRKGQRFITYANFWMKKEITILLENEQRNNYCPIEYQTNKEGEVKSKYDYIQESTQHFESDYDIELMMRNLSVLNEREYDVICRHYGLFDTCEETLQEIGKSYGISREAIRLIKEKALTKLKKNIW